MAGGMISDLYAVLGLRPDKEAWAKGNELVDGLKTSLKWFAGLAAVHALESTVSATIELGGHLDDLRQKTGLSAESLQQWGFAAKLGGSDMDSFAHATGHLARTIKEAQGGSEDAEKALRQVGLTGAALKAALKGGDGLDAALLEISSKFADLKDGPTKTALAMAVFGKSGAELIPTLNLGAQGLAELRKEAIDLGAVMSEDTVSAADALGDNIDKVKMSIVGLKNQAVAALLPLLKELVDGFLDWIKANKQLVIETITVGVHALVTALGVLRDIGGVVVGVIQFLSEHTLLASAIFTALGVVITAVALEAAAAWLIGFWPIVAIVAFITALVLIFHKLLEALLDGKGIFADIGRGIYALFKGIVDSIVNLFVGIKDFFVSIAKGVKDAFWSVIDWVTGKIEWAWDQLKKIGHYVTHPGELASDTVDFFRGGPDGPSATPGAIPLKRSSVAGPAVQVQSGDTTVTINAMGTNASEIGEIVDQKIKDHHDKVVRDVNASSGGEEN